MSATSVLTFEVRPCVRKAPPVLAPSAEPPIHLKGSWHTQLPRQTNLLPIHGRSILYIEDNDNIRLSLQEHHAILCYRSFKTMLSSVVQSVIPWVVITTSETSLGHTSYFRGIGFNVLAIRREAVQTEAGLTIKGNADLDIAFQAGYLAASRQLDILIGSGDGDLCIAIARGVKRLVKQCGVFTLSVPGATSHRILTRNNPHLFDGNIYIGHDLIRPRF